MEETEPPSNPIENSTDSIIPVSEISRQPSSQIEISRAIKRLEKFSGSSIPIDSLTLFIASVN